VGVVEGWVGCGVWEGGWRGGGGEGGEEEEETTKGEHHTAVRVIIYVDGRCVAV